MKIPKIGQDLREFIKEKIPEETSGKRKRGRKKEKPLPDLDIEVELEEQELLPRFRNTTYFNRRKP